MIDEAKWAIEELSKSLFKKKKNNGCKFKRNVELLF
jgi:hypothetical protein